MKVEEFFQKCGGIEKGIGDLYRRLGALSSNPPEVSELFKTIAGEEDHHSHAMELMAGLLNTTDIMTVNVAAEQAALWMEEELKKANEFLDSGKPMPPREALSLAIRLESSALEAHNPTYLYTTSDELRKIIIRLTSDTTSHREKYTAALAGLKA